MEHLPFMLWMLLYPLACTTEHYMSAKRKQVEGDTEKTSDGTKAFVALVEIAIWIGVGRALY